MNAKELFRLLKEAAPVETPTKPAPTKPAPSKPAPERPDKPTKHPNPFRRPVRPEDDPDVLPKPKACGSNAKKLFGY